MLYLVIFGLEFEKAIAIFEIQRPHICLIAKFVAKSKILKFGTKMPNLSISKQKMPYLGISGP